jgi:tetratricopeptide (TPR) repeat protein
MEEWLKIKLEKANELIEKEEYSDAIRMFIEAAELTEENDELLQIHNSLAYLFQTIGEQIKAIDHYSKAIQLIRSKDEIDQLDKENMAHLYSSMAHSYMLSDQSEKAIETLIASIKGYTELLATREGLRGFLALSQFNLSSLYIQKKDFFAAKKNLKEAITNYEVLIEDKQDKFLPYLANAYAQLAQVFEEESDLYTAYLNYKKSMQTFKRLVEEDPALYLPYLAASYNNMGICHKQLDESQKAAQAFEESLTIYQQLAQNNPKEFTPFVAGNFNSLGVLYTDLDDKEKGIEFYNKALELYTQLSAESPAEFSHYKATCLHNLGVIHDEKLDFASAMKYYQSARQLRLELVEKEPEAFTLDLCVTLMNIVTLYHSRIEKEKDMALIPPSIEIIDEVEKRLFYVDDSMPVIKSMKSDVEYFREFFTEISY